MSHRLMRNISAAMLFFAASAVHAGFADCQQFFPNKTPPKVAAGAPSQQRELCFNAFAVLHSGQSKTPVYVVERLNRNQLLDARGEERTERFYEEARLPRAERATLEDYKASFADGENLLRFDRGHMAPAADQPNPEAMAQSFSLSNMVPQSPAQNRGVWAKNVERATRHYVMRAEGDVYVFTGPVFTDPKRTLGKSKVWIPTYLYKLVYDSAKNRAWAYWVENTDSAHMTRPLSYDELVSRTGIEFLPGLRPQR